MDNITLIGMPGSGKSTVGRALAQTLDYQFLDIDQLIEARGGAPLQTILDRLGVDDFLDLESRVVHSINCRRHVISPGGSAICRECAANHLKSLGPVIYLDVPMQSLAVRIRNLTTRGIAMQPDQTLDEVMRLRAPLYRKYADHIIDCSGDLSVQQTVARVLDALKNSQPSG